MSTRQTKKRKGRGTHLNRERTVTTLTEGSEGSFMAAEDPHGNLMSSPFSVASSSNGPSAAISPSFAMTPSFSSFPYSYMSPMPAPPLSGPAFNQPQSPAHFYPAQPLPSGENDLEILERLKETIKNGQHEFFRPVPRPAALASIYLGPHNATFVPPHPEQVPHEQYQNGRHDHHQASTDSAISISDTRKPSSDRTHLSPNHASSAPGTLPLEATEIGNKPTENEPPGLSISVNGLSGAHRSPHDKSLSASMTTGDQRGLSRVATEKVIGDASLKGSADIKDEPRDPRSLDWPNRAQNGSEEDIKAPRYDNDRYGPNGRPNGDSRFMQNDNSRPGLRFPRDYDRDKDRERERDRQRDRDWDRDRDRDRRGVDFGNRYREDRRSDERLRYTDHRRPPPDPRNFEHRHDPRSNDPLRRWDSKSSNGSLVSPARPTDDRPGVATEARAARPLGEERSLDFRDGKPPAEERSSDTLAPRLGEDRSFEGRGPRPAAEDHSFEHRAPRPSTDDRSYHSRVPSLDDRDPRDRRGSLMGDRRPTLGNDDRFGKAADDRRPTDAGALDRTVRLQDDKRALPPASDERQGKAPTDDRRSVGPPGLPGAPPETVPNEHQRRPSASTEDRRLPPPSETLIPMNSPAIDRNTGPPGDRRPPPLATAAERQRLPNPATGPDRPSRGSDDYSRPISSTTAGSTTRASPVRTQSLQDDRAATRPAVSLEDRLSRPASLQERIGARPTEPPPARLEDRVSRPVLPPEQRAAPPTDDRAGRNAPLQPDDRRAGSVRPASDASTGNTRPGDTRPLPPDVNRPLATTDRVPRPDDRGRTLANDRYTSGNTSATDRPPVASAIAGPPPRYNHAGARPASLVREDANPTAFKPRGATVSPRRPEYRPVDRSAYPDRYEHDKLRERRPDAMDVDAPARLPDRSAPQPYRRPSPPPYNRPERTWAPPAETYPGRHPLDAPPAPAVYGRDWRDDERPGFDEWSRNWDRERDYERDRDPRFVERDAAIPSWETREERERRVAATFQPGDVQPPRTYEARPPNARLADGYIPDERDRPYDRARYPEAPAGIAPRVRPRSPSPTRRPGIDDLRPPLKRPRDDAYAAGYFSPSGHEGPREYPAPRMRTPPANPPMYYDDSRPDYPHGASPTGPRDRDRDRAYPDRDDYSSYDRRDAAPLTRMAPPRSPGPYGRPVYGRDDRRYGVPPPRP